VPRVIVLGAGFAGLAAAYSLRRAVQDDVEVTVVSEAESYIYRPSLPLVALGYRSSEDLSLFLPCALSRSHINFVRGRVTGILCRENSVVVNGSRYGYDYLVVAMGSEIAFDEVPGLREHGHVLCEAHLIHRLKAALENFKGGVINVALGLNNPFEMVDIGFVFLLHQYLKQRGLDRVAEIHYFTPNAEILPQVGERARSAVANFFKLRHIAIHPGRRLKALIPDGIVFDGGEAFPSQLSVLIPPYRGREPVRRSDIAGERGYIPTNDEMQALKAENVYAAGDVVLSSGPKSARKAVAQGKVAGENIAVKLTGKGAPRRFRERNIKCFIELGNRRAIYIESDILWGGRSERVWIGRLPYLVKVGLEKFFLWRRGDI